MTYIIFIAIGFAVGVFLTALYLKGYYTRRGVKSRNISIEEVKDFLKKTEDAERNGLCWDILKTCTEGFPNDTSLHDLEFVEILAPCEGHNCSGHVSREDSCSDMVEIDGKAYCKGYINLNKLCGLESKLDKPRTDLLTDDEIKIFSKCFNEFIKSLEDKNKA